MGTKPKGRAPRPSAAGRGAKERERLADLAEAVLSVAREINLRVGADRSLVHLTATEINVVRHVGRNPGTTPTEACERLGLKRSNFSVALRAVRERGMVAVVPDERDGRCVRLHPTDAAAKNLAGHRRRWAACLEAALGGGADVGDCVGLLLRIDEALRAERGGRADE